MSQDKQKKFEGKGGKVKYSKGAPAIRDYTSEKVITYCYVDGCSYRKESDCIHLPSDKKSSAIVYANEHMSMHTESEKVIEEKKKRGEVVVVRSPIINSAQFCKGCQFMYLHYYREGEDSHFKKATEHKNVYTGCGTLPYDIVEKCERCTK